MVFRIEPHKGRSWQVFRDGVPVFSAGYSQVEDWLDWTENSGGYSTSPETPSKSPGVDSVALRERWVRKWRL